MIHLYRTAAVHFRSVRAVCSVLVVHVASFPGTLGQQRWGCGGKTCVVWGRRGRRERSNGVRAGDIIDAIRIFMFCDAVYVSAHFVLCYLPFATSHLVRGGSERGRLRVANLSVPCISSPLPLGFSGEEGGKGSERSAFYAISTS
jgi:hypothetical protein